MRAVPIVDSFVTSSATFLATGVQTLVANFNEISARFVGSNFTGTIEFFVSLKDADTVYYPVVVMRIKDGVLINNETDFTNPLLIEYSPSAMVANFKILITRTTGSVTLTYWRR